MDKKYALLEALADDTRLRIVMLLAKGELCVCEIYPRVHRTQSTVSIQLAKLVSLGILASRRDGRWMYYKIKDQRVYAVLKLLEGERYEA